MGLKRNTIIKLREAKALMLAHPDNYNQHEYARGDGSLCGTTLCIAGFVVRANVGRDAFRRRVKSYRTDCNWGKNHTSYSFFEEARDILGITDTQAEKLFCGYMPDRLMYEYENAANGSERSKVGAKRIELFIRSGGNE